jgi:hypothetical protein
MSLVVNFLSMLATEAENGGVKRMLGVCSEFERIAKVVLDKAEKETSSKRKRKNADDIAKAKAQHQHQQQQRRGSMPQPHMNQTPSMSSVFSPNLGAQPPPNGFGASPVNGHTNGHPNGHSSMGGSPNSQLWPTDYAPGNEYTTPNTNGMTPFADIPGFTNGNEVNSPLNINSFQQPFVPQDLWQMPMTLEWDWADMTGGQYPSFENGVMGDPSLAMNNNQHLQHRQM